MPSPTPASPTPIEAQRLERWGTLAAAAGAVGVPVFGHMRLEGRRGTRDVLLGTASRSLPGAAIIDWERAPLAEVFFGTSPGEAYEVEHDGRILEGTLLEKALFTFEGAALREIEAVTSAPSSVVRTDLDALQTEEARYLAGRGGWTRAAPALGFDLARSEHARSRPVAPIEVVLDPPQRAAVERPASESLLILGAAGFGKTTVALHRLARLAASAGPAWSALVLVPTEGLRRLSAMLLERLRVEGVEVLTVDRWLTREARRVFAGLPARDAGDTSAAVVRFKRHPALRVVLGEVARRRSGPATRADLLHLFGDRAFLERVVAASEGELSPRLIGEVLEHTHVQFSSTTEAEHRHVDADRLVTLDGQRIDAGTPLEDAESLDAEDAPVLFALDHLRRGRDHTRHGRLRGHDHILLDEAQELAPLELEVIGRALKAGGALTLAGDADQQTDDTAAFRGWAATEAELSRPLVRVELEVSYRCPPDVLAFARGLFSPEAQRRSPAPSPTLGLSRFPSPCHLMAALTGALRRAAAEDPRASVAVVYRTREAARAGERLLARSLATHLALDGDFRFGPGIQVTTVQEVKGLELDVVVLPDLSPATYPDEPEARRALYVAATRPLHRLWLMTSGAWSPLITGA